jgi:hypothetical protein
MRRIALLALAVAAYTLTAWLVAPGFYDGIGPVQPYNWVSPPPAFVNSNLPPKSGHLVDRVVGGVSDANSAYTDDGQLVLGFLPGAFDAGSASTVTVDIKPQSQFPPPAPYQFATNVYLVTASAPLVKQMNVTLRYSNGIPQPSDVYLAAAADAQWSPLGAPNLTAQVYVISARSDSLGYFAAGFPANAQPGNVTLGGSTLPIIVAGAIGLVLLAGIPMAMMRRRRMRPSRARAGPARDDDDDED